MDAGSIHAGTSRSSFPQGRRAPAFDGLLRGAWPPHGRGSMDAPAASQRLDRRGDHAGRRRRGGILPRCPRGVRERPPQRARGVHLDVGRDRLDAAARDPARGRPGPRRARVHRGQSGRLAGRVPAMGENDRRAQPLPRARRRRRGGARARRPPGRVRGAGERRSGRPAARRALRAVAPGRQAVLLPARTLLLAHVDGNQRPTRRSRLLRGRRDPAPRAAHGPRLRPQRLPAVPVGIDNLARGRGADLSRRGGAEDRARAPRGVPRRFRHDADTEGRPRDRVGGSTRRRRGAHLRRPRLARLVPFGPAPARRAVNDDRPRQRLVDEGLRGRARPRRARRRESAGVAARRPRADRVARSAGVRPGDGKGTGAGDGAR